MKARAWRSAKAKGRGIGRPRPFPELRYRGEEPLAVGAGCPVGFDAKRRRKARRRMRRDGEEPAAGRMRVDGVDERLAHLGGVSGALAAGHPPVAGVNQIAGDDRDESDGAGGEQQRPSLRDHAAEQRRGKRQHAVHHERKGLVGIALHLHEVGSDEAAGRRGKARREAARSPALGSRARTQRKAPAGKAMGEKAPAAAAH